MIKKELLSSAVIKEIQHLISTNEFEPGDKLPSQHELAARLGVSRTALREALKQLALMGVVNIEQGKGTFVSTSQPSALLKSLAPTILMDQATTLELLEARLYIESALAYLAAKYASKEEIEDLDYLLMGMKKDLKEKDFEGFSEKDLEYHLVVAKASRNKVLARFMQTLRDILHQFIRDASYAIPATLASSINYHTKILKAIKERDRDAAKKHMENHIMHIIQVFRKFYQNEND